MGNPRRTDGEKGHWETYLSPSQKEILLHNVAFEGRSWFAYQEWCRENNIPPDKQYTQSYWAKLCDKWAPRIAQIRLETSTALGKGDGGTRVRRLAALNEDLVTVKMLIKNLDLDTKDGMEMFIKLSARKQGILQAIAQQRGEWGTKIENDTSTRGSIEMAGMFDRHFSAVDREVE